MTGRTTGLYWRLCWGFFTPLLMIVILMYTFVTWSPLKYKEYFYPDSAIGTCSPPHICQNNSLIFAHLISAGAGWAITAFGLAQLPIWAVVAYRKTAGDTIWEKVRGSFRPIPEWGPTDPATLERYKKLRIFFDEAEMGKNQNWLSRVKRNFFG